MLTEHLMDAVERWTASDAGAPIDVWVDRRPDWHDAGFWVTYRRPGSDCIHLRGGLSEAEALVTAAELRIALASTWVATLPSSRGHE
jgi:hypothetical protein